MKLTLGDIALVAVLGLIILGPPAVVTILTVRIVHLEDKIKKMKNETVMVEQRDSYDGEYTQTMTFARFVDLYPRLVERHDPDFPQQLLDGKRVHALSSYFIKEGIEPK